MTLDVNSQEYDAPMEAFEAATKAGGGRGELRQEATRNLCAFTGARYRCAAGYDKNQMNGCSFFEAIPGRGTCRSRELRPCFVQCNSAEARKKAHRWGVDRKEAGGCGGGLREAPAAGS